ncbi:MAG: mevalonate kinase [Myxococcota bacterium]
MAAPEASASAGARGEAGGKLILGGEHAVVYGVPAVVVAIPRGLRATAAPGEVARVDLLGTRRCRRGDPGELGEAFGALLDAGRPVSVGDVVVRGSLPPGMGLGFSAAAAVAIARAVEALAARSSSPPPREDDEGATVATRVRARADAWERAFHGNPSGVDVAAAMSGGCLRFDRRTGATEPVLLRDPLVLAVGLTGTGGATKTLVAGVAARRREEPVVFDQTLRAIAEVVETSIGAMATGNYRALGASLDRNHELLASWGVSTPALDDLCVSARRAGAWGAQLTGAGGGGAAVAVAADAGVADEVVAAWRARGYDGFVTIVPSSDTETTTTRGKERTEP